MSIQQKEHFYVTVYILSFLGGLLSEKNIRNPLKIVGLHPTFSRHGKVEASFTLLIWLNENVPMKAYSIMLANGIVYL